MFMKKRSLIFSLLFICCSFLSFGQISSQDVIYLKNGSVFKGKIIKYEQGKDLTLKIDGDQTIIIADSDIKRIVQADISTLDEDIEDATSEIEETDGLSSIKKKEKVAYEYKTAGWYNTTYIAFFAGNDGNDDTGNGNFKLGSGLHNVTGKQLSPLVGIGLGIGLDNYSRRGETILPVFVEFKGFPIAKNRQFYYVVSAGYGFAFKRESFGITDATGGYMFHPALGIRLGTPDGTNVNIDLGLKMQKAFFREQLLDGDIDERDIVFQRISLRVGLTLWK